MDDKSTVVIVDPQPLFRFGIAHALTNTRAFNVVGQGASADDAVSLAIKHSPRLAFMDVEPSQTGLSTIDRVTAASPKTCWIVLTELDDRAFVEKAFQLGASGYLLKSVEVTELCKAASTVSVGEVYVCQKLVNNLFKVAESSPTSTIVFSEREEGILRLLAQGMSNKGIANELLISEKTAKYYLTAIMKKLHVKNRVEVALFAARRQSMR